MIQRVALLAATLTAALVLAAGLALAGLGPVRHAPAAATAEPDAVIADVATSPPVQVDTVYVTPKVKPRDVTVTRTVRSRTHGEREHEGGGDD